MTAIVISEGEAHRAQMVRLLGAVSVAKVQEFSHGQEAWSSITEATPDVVVMGWRFPGLSGLALLNRIRRFPATVLTPVIVASEHLKAPDLALLEELPCTASLPQPWTGPTFKDKYGLVLREADWHRKNGGLIEALLEMAGRNGNKALELLKNPLAAAPNPVPLTIMAARQLRVNGHHSQAAQILRELLSKHPKNVLALSEIGKVYYLMGLQAEARRSLDEAYRLSPHNIERLTQLAEVNLVGGDPATAAAHFTKALEIDPEDSVSEVGLRMIRSKTGVAPAANKDAISFTMAGILNGKGITSVQTGKFADGVRHYQAALSCLLGSKSLSMVHFNLGLAFLRWRKPREALQWFERAMALAGKAYPKAEKYLQRLSAKVDPLTEKTGDSQAATATAASGPGYAPIEADDDVDPDYLEEESLVPSDK